MQTVQPSGADQRREQVLERLSALEVARKAERDKRKEDTEAQADPKESIAKFLAQFASQQQHVGSMLDSLKQGMAGEGAKPANDSLDKLASLVLQMERSCADASYFLPSYDLKQCTLSVAELKQRIDAARAELAPKRKFAFASKVNRVKGAELSTAAAEANPVGAAPVSAGGTSVVAGAEHAGSVPNGEAGGANGLAAEGVPSSSSSGPGIATATTPSSHDVALVQQGRGLMGLRNQVVVLHQEQVAGRDYVLIDLQDCRVYLLGHLPALRLLGLRNTTVVAGPITGACFADTVVNCTIVLATYQVRIHSSTDTDFYLRVRSKPIIEHSSRVRFAPWVLAGAEARGQEAAVADGDQGGAAASSSREASFHELLAEHKLGVETGMYSQVEDFGWIKAMQSPNWSILPEHERIAVPVSWSLADAQADSGTQASGSA